MRHPSGQVTIYDVAKAANVAPSTVSRAFSHPGRVAATTSARIQRVAVDLGYRTFAAEHVLPQSATRLMALVVPDVSNPYYTQLIRGVQSAAFERGYDVLLCDSAESAERERAAIIRLLHVVDGLIVASSRQPNSALRSLAKQAPLVLLNRNLPDMAGVIADNARGIREALKMLSDLGHKDVTYVPGPDSSWTNGVRLQTLHDAGEELGMAVHRTSPVIPNFEGGLAIAEHLARHLPTAILAFNDLVAIGIIRGLGRAGLIVPDDASVVGCDNILMSQLVTPRLTTIASPQLQMGQMAAAYLAGIIRGTRAAGGGSTVLPTMLRTRESTGVARSLSSD